MGFEDDIDGTWTVPGIDREDSAVMTAVRLHRGHGGAAAMPGHEIAKLARMDQRTAEKRLAALVLRGYVTSLGRMQGGLTYRVTPADGMPTAEPAKRCPTPERNGVGHRNETGSGTVSKRAPAPERSREDLVGSHVATEPQSHTGGRGREPSPAEYQALVERVLDCYLVTARKPRPMQLGGVADDKLVRLVAVHGLHRVRLEIEECGGSEMPVDRLAARLARTAAATIAVEVYRPTAETPTPISPEGFAKLLEGTE